MLLVNIASDMEHGGEPALLPQLVQDEDVGGYRGHPHELWSGAECLQSLVSDCRYKSMAMTLQRLCSSRIEFWSVWWGDKDQYSGRCDWLKGIFISASVC